MSDSVNSFFVDVYTPDEPNLSRRLRRLKTTTRLDRDGQYVHCPNCSRVYLETSWSEEELDTWLWKTKGVDYIGACEAEKRSY